MKRIIETSESLENLGVMIGAQKKAIFKGECAKADVTMRTAIECFVDRVIENPRMLEDLK